VPFVRVPVPRFTPHALTVIPPPVSVRPAARPAATAARAPTLVHGSIPCVASFAPAQTPSRIVAPSRRSGQLAGVPPRVAARRQVSCRRCAAAAPFAPAAVRSGSDGPDRF
jgi:hypothetical protein